MALLSHDDGLIYKSYIFILSFMNIKEDFKNVGNDEQMKHKRKEKYQQSL